VIVCGVDLSDASASSIGVARRLADGLGTRLLIAHVVDGPEDQTERLDALRAEAGAGDAEVRLLPPEPAPAAEALMTLAAEEGARLLVVGSRGQSALRSGLTGSVTRELASRSEIPVVVVPPGYEERATGDAVICGVDGSDHALAAVRIASGLAEALGGRLVVVHALKDLRATISYLGARSTQPALTGQPDEREREAVAIVEAGLAAAGDGAVGVVEPGAPWDALEAVAEREGGRAVVVAAR
jgi:nucleotide-binding universal stress UspA family protein